MDENPNNRDLGSTLGSSLGPRCLVGEFFPSCLPSPSTVGAPGYKVLPLTLCVGEVDVHSESLLSAGEAAGHRSPGSLRRAPCTWPAHPQAPLRGQQTALCLQ